VTLRSDLSRTTDALAAVEADFPAFDGNGDAPSPDAVQYLITSAQSQIAQAISQTNADIDKVNADVSAAYTYAADAASASSCGTAPAAPSPLHSVS
jgi:hypothetical protein